MTTFRELLSGLDLDRFQPVFIAACLPPPEALACRVCADRLAVMASWVLTDIVDAAFLLLPLEQRPKRLAAWRGNWEMYPVTITVDEQEISVYLLTPYWIAALAELIDEFGDVPDAACSVRRFP